MKGLRIRDRLVLTEGNVELAAQIEPAEPVIARSIQVVKKRRRFLRFTLASPDERIEPFTVRVEDVGIVFRLNRDPKTLLEPAVEVDQVGIRIVEKGFVGLEAQRDRQTPAKRLDQSTTGVSLPNRKEFRNLPSLAASPFQGGTKDFS